VIGQTSQKACEALPAFAVKTFSTLGHQEHVQGFQRPQRGSDSADFGNAIQKFHNRLGLLVLETPRKRD
jgi:hypothetical protein